MLRDTRVLSCGHLLFCGSRKINSHVICWHLKPITECLIKVCPQHSTYHVAHLQPACQQLVGSASLAVQCTASLVVQCSASRCGSVFCFPLRFSVPLPVAVHCSTSLAVQCTASLAVQYTASLTVQYTSFCWCWGICVVSLFTTCRHNCLQRLSICIDCCCTGHVVASSWYKYMM
jgi:hypothetical protein